MTPVYAPVHIESSQMNEMNHDFSNRQPFHQTTTMDSVLHDGTDSNISNPTVNIIV